MARITRATRTVKLLILAVGGSFAVAPGAGVTEEEDEGEGQGEDRGNEEVTAEVADEEGRVYAEHLDKEATDGVQAHVEQEDVATLEAVREASGHEEEYEANENVPDRFVEERRVEGGGVVELRGPVLGGNLYGPWQA